MVRYTDNDILEMLRECKERHSEVSPRVFNEDEDFCSASLVMRRFGSWTDAKEAAGIEENLRGITGRKKQYSDEEIFSQLREVYRREGSCTTEDLAKQDDGSWVHPSTVIDRFGSWKEAKKQAELGEYDDRTNNSRPRQYTDDEWLEFIRQCEEKYGRVSQRLFDSDDEFPSSAGVRKRFPSWSEALERAGVDEVDTREYTREELLEMLRECARRHGKCTSNNFASDDDFCSPETVQRRFGSWNAAKEAAGLENGSKPDDREERSDDDA
jgi:hypothetical protein